MMASGVFQMTDKYGCHGDGANEVVIRVLCWQMAVNLTYTHTHAHREREITHRPTF